MRGRASCSRLRTPARDSKEHGPVREGSATGESSVARIAGVNIPTNKRVLIALQYIHGIGQKKASEIIEKVKIPAERRVSQLSDQEVLQIREVIDRDYMVEGDLRREVGINVKRLMDLGCYRGLRHRRGLPVRGQRTHTNARTRKGPAKSIAGKKKEQLSDQGKSGPPAPSERAATGSSMGKEATQRVRRRERKN